MKLHSNRYLQIVVLAFAYLPSSGFAQELPTAKRVQAIVAIDYNSGLEGLRLDNNNISKLGEMIRGTGATVEIHTIPSTSINPKSIVQTIRNIQVGPDETLLFYYSGHGATDPEYGHYLSLTDGSPYTSLLRSVILDEMKKKQSQLSILLTDCCSSRRKAKLPPVAGAPPDLRRILRCLFLQHRGIVDITAASYYPNEGYGEYAVGLNSTGGLFTCGLMMSLDKANFTGLDKNQDDFISWKEFFPEIRSETEGLFDVYKYQFNVTDQKTQKPHAFSLGVRSDVALEHPNNQLNRPRFGAAVCENYNFGIVIRSVADDMPASQIIKLNGQTTNGHGVFLPGDLITRANGTRVRNI